MNLLDMVQDDGYFMEDDTVGRRFTVEAEDIQEMGGRLTFRTMDRGLRNCRFLSCMRGMDFIGSFELLCAHED